jgi:hypothetical protein
MQMRKLRSNVNIFFHIVLFSSIVNLFFSLFPLLSNAYTESGPETHYSSCAQLQNRMNKYNNPVRAVKGFERAELMRRTYHGNTYMVYCNGGTLVNRDNGTTCRGYIGYGYDPESGTGAYFGRWGWTDGLPNDADSGKERYCKRLK